MLPGRRTSWVPSYVPAPLGMWALPDLVETGSHWLRPDSEPPAGTESHPLSPSGGTALGSWQCPTPGRVLATDPEPQPSEYGLTLRTDTPTLTPSPQLWEHRDVREGALFWLNIIRADGVIHC